MMLCHAFVVFGDNLYLEEAEKAGEVFCFVLFCFVLFYFVLFCFVLLGLFGFSLSKRFIIIINILSITIINPSLSPLPPFPPSLFHSLPSPLPPLLPLLPLLPLPPPPLKKKQDCMGERPIKKRIWCVSWYWW